MAIRVEVAGTTKVKKITRGPGSGTTIVKRVTVGAPNRIGEPTIGAIRTLDDVNGQIGQGEGTYLRFDSASGIYLHRPFDSDAMAVGLTSISWNADSGKLTLVTGSGDSTDPYSKSFTETILTADQLQTLNSQVGAGLTWAKSGNDDEFRTAKEYIDSDSEVYDIRSVGFENDANGRPQFRLTLAYFSPTITTTGQSLYWDDSATLFTVSVDNPADFLTRYIDSVSSISSPTANVSSDITLYNDSAKSNTPAGGIDWTQIFRTDPVTGAVILSTSDGLSGGSASATLTFNEFNGDSSIAYTTDSFTTNWLDANLELSMNSLTGNTFLQTYNSVAYTLSKTGVSDSASHSATITPTGGTLSNDSGSGTFTFTDVLHKDNNTGRELSATCDFVRAAGISTAGAYTVQDSASVTSISASFTYPSFWMFTAAVGSPPASTDIIDGTSFDATNVGAVLGNQARSFSGTINNPESSPQAFWFGVRSAASQPTTFQTGSSSSLLVAVTPTTGSVSIEPATPPSGYSAEGYSLYGITLQPGDTFVSIS